jgi:uncharacterized membrane protein
MKVNAQITVKTGNFFLSAVAILGGCTILFLTNTQNLDLLYRGLPGAGFFPFLCATGIILCGIGNLVSTISRVKARDPELEKSLVDENELTNFLYIIGLSLFTMIAYQWIGLLVCMFVVVLVVCRFLSKESWRKSIIVAAGTFVVFYLVFVFGLHIPMPDSLIGI